MISTLLKEDNHIEYIGKSTDTKPAKARNGSFFLEIDTCKLFAFDESTSTWIELK